MSVAIRTATRIQDMDDANVTLGVGVDEYVLTYDHDTAKFVLRAPAAPFAGILATGATTGATSQAQAFTVGVTVGSVATPATLLQVAETSTASPRGIMSSQHSTGVDGARFHMRKSRGTNATPTVITTGDVLGRLVASGYDGSNYLEMGGIDIVSAGTIASTRVPTEIRFLTATDAAPSVLTQRMVIDKAGNVGIGTTSPATALHVVGAATITGGIRPAADSTTALQLQNAAGTSVLNVDTTNARVGIGTAAPGMKLDIAGGAAYENIRISDNLTADTIRRAGLVVPSWSLAEENASVVNAWASQTAVTIGIGGGVSTQNSVYAISFFTSETANTLSGTNRMHISSTGLVGIGTTAPATALHVVGAATITGGIRPAADSTTALQLQNASGTSMLNVDTTNGRVGIGTTAPKCALQVGALVDTLSSDPAILISRAVDATGSGNAHAFVDRSVVSRAGSIGFASYDAYPSVGGTALTYDHYIAYQARPIYGNTGTTGRLTGFGHYPKVNYGTVTEMYGVRVAEWLNPYATGTVTTHYGVYVEPLALAGSNWGVYVAGTTSSYFGGNVGIADTAPAEALDVTGNINTTGVVKVDDVQVLSNRVIDARCADVANSGDATTDGLIDALRDAMVAHGLIAAA